MALRCAPFVVFAKRAPRFLPKYNVDKDFEYYFFNDVMQHWSGLEPSFLTSGRNAKTDFPQDFVQYFKDDAQVCQSYSSPKVKVIIEPWGPPHLCTMVHTRKTCMVDEEDSPFMLGCFSPFDSLEMGITQFRAQPRPPELSKLNHITDSWCASAWDQLPQPAFVFSSNGPRHINNLAEVALADDNVVNLLDTCAARVRDTPDAQSWEFCVSSGPGHTRVWIWRIDGSNDLACSFRPIASTMPPLITKRILIPSKL